MLAGKFLICPFHFICKFETHNVTLSIGLVGGAVALTLKLRRLASSLKQAEQSLQGASSAFGLVLCFRAQNET